MAVFPNSNNARMDPVFNNCRHCTLMEADIGSCSLCSGIFRFWMIVEKNLFKNLSFFKILVSSTSVIFSLDIISLDRNGLTILKKKLLSHTFFTLRF